MNYIRDKLMDFCFNKLMIKGRWGDDQVKMRIREYYGRVTIREVNEEQKMMKIRSRRRWGVKDDEEKEQKMIKMKSKDDERT